MPSRTKPLPEPMLTQIHMDYGQMASLRPQWVNQNWKTWYQNLFYLNLVPVNNNMLTKALLTHPILLTHWGRVTYICVGNLTIIVSDNGLSPYRRQAIIWTNAGILLIGPLGTNFSEILIEILTFSFKKMHLKGLSAKRRPFCLGLNVLKQNNCTIRDTNTKCIFWKETADEIRHRNDVLK